MSQSTHRSLFDSRAISSNGGVPYTSESTPTNGIRSQHAKLSWYGYIIIIDTHSYVFHSTPHFDYLYNIVTAAIVFTEHLDVSESVEPVNGQITAIAKALDHPFSYCRGSASQSLNRFSRLRFAVRIRSVRPLNPTWSVRYR